MKKFKLDELKRICHSSIQPNYSWWLGHVSRKISLPFTALIAKTNITPNQLTFFSLVIGLLMITYFLKDSASAMVRGAFLFQAFYVVDCMDGELARYRAYSARNVIVSDKLSVNQTGLFLDKIVHYILIPLIFFSLGFRQVKITSHLYPLVIGFVAGISILFIDLIEDCKAKCILESLKKGACVINKGEKTDIIETNTIHSKYSLKKIFTGLHQACFFYNIMNIFGITAVLNFLIPFKYDIWNIEFSWPIVFLIFYAFASTVVWLGKIIIMIKRDDVTREIEKTSHILKERLAN